MKECPKCFGRGEHDALVPRRWWERLLFLPAAVEVVRCRVCLGSGRVGDELELVDTPEARAELRGIAKQLKRSAKARLKTAKALVPCSNCQATGQLEAEESGMPSRCPVCRGRCWVEGT